MSVENPVGHRLAYGDDPAEPDNGRTDHPLCPRGLDFTDDTGKLSEVMPPEWPAACLVVLPSGCPAGACAPPCHATRRSQASARAA
ncbi:hypothetical protein ACFV0O_32590 [Kitasatospora sp. NPDC059577]|uniref:hypothetical protein n=1 Tax=Kitasatospora sp. NPDC059577 TaxID=3346873 RepID=UPI00369CEF7D